MVLPLMVLRIYITMETSSYVLFCEREKQIYKEKLIVVFAMQTSETASKQNTAEKMQNEINKMNKEDEKKI